MRVLWLTVNREERIPRIFLPLQHAFSQLQGVDVKFIIRDEGRLSWNRKKIKARDFLPLLDSVKTNEFDLCFTDAPFAFTTENWEDIKIPKACLIEDQHGPVVKQYVNDMINCGFEYFFLRYAEAVNVFFPELLKYKLFSLPHCIEPEIYHKYESEKSYKILQTGRIGNVVYPIRTAICRALDGKSYYSRLEHPADGRGDGRDKNKVQLVDHRYAEELSKSIIGIQGTSIYRYPTKKTFEIPACGSILASDWISDYKILGFIPNKNMIVINPYIDIVKQAETWLSEFDLKSIAEKGFNLIHQKHTADTRAKMLFKCFYFILNPATTPIQLYPYFLNPYIYIS